MLGFILSKMNLLIMVTAIFAIIAYFTFFLGRSVELRESQALLNRFAENTYGVLSSTGQCHQTIIAIPHYIHSVGTGEFRNQMRFLVHVDKILQSDHSTKISFSILRKKDKTVLAAKPFVTNALVRLYQWDSQEQNLTEETDIPIELNPVAKNFEDAILLVKEVHEGKTNLYIVPCSSESGTCSANYEKLVCLVKKNYRSQSMSCSDCSGTISDSCLTAEGFNCVGGPQT